jgi:hypothetical protein
LPRLLPALSETLRTQLTTSVFAVPAQADRGHFEPTFSQLALLHRCFSILPGSFRHQP